MKNHFICESNIVFVIFLKGRTSMARVIYQSCFLARKCLSTPTILSQLKRFEMCQQITSDLRPSLSEAAYKTAALVLKHGSDERSVSNFYNIYSYFL